MSKAKKEPSLQVAAQLRSDLVHSEGPEGGVVLNDPVSLRQFVFDETQSDVLCLLNGETTSIEIAGEVFEDEDQASAVDNLIARADSLGLLETIPPLNSMEIRTRQAAAMREATARLRSSRVVASVKWAQENLPYYAATLAGYDISSAEELATLPFTTKKDIRENFPSRLVPAAHDLQKLVEDGNALLSTTSGSTGGRLQYVYDLQRKVPATLALEPAFSDDLKVVTFTTPICSGQVCHRGGVPFEERLIGHNRLTLNSSERVMRLSREQVEECISDIARHEGTVMYVDPVYMTALVRAFQRFELPIPKMLGVRTGFEYLSVLHKEILSEAMGVAVKPSYGATDLGGPAAISCEHGRYHAIENSMYFEFVRDGRPVLPGEVGAIAATSLRHPYTRLIRYLVGDLGRPIERCGCVWDDWPAFEMEGRLQDVLFATDGSRVTTRDIDDLMLGLKWIDFYELVQKEDRLFHFQAMRREGVDVGSDEKDFLDRLRGVLGSDAEVRVQYVREMPIEQSLKYPMTKQRSRPPLTDW